VYLAVRFEACLINGERASARGCAPVVAKLSSLWKRDAIQNYSSLVSNALNIPQVMSPVGGLISEQERSFEGSRVDGSTSAARAVFPRHLAVCEYSRP
jgi:hypothetical protein